MALGVILTAISVLFGFWSGTFATKWYDQSPQIVKRPEEFAKFEVDLKKNKGINYAQATVLLSLITLVFFITGIGMLTDW